MKNNSSSFNLPGVVLPSAKRLTKYLGTMAALGLVTVASAEDITIHLAQNASISRKTVQYRCDAQAAKIGLPSGSFPVEYINGGGNSLAVVPINGNSLIFANVISGSGARYAAEQYIWWEAKGAVTVYADSLNGKLQSVCNPAPAK